MSCGGQKRPKLANNWKKRRRNRQTMKSVDAGQQYMNEKQLAFPPGCRCSSRIFSAGATTEHLREDTVVVPDLADRATIEEHALELRTRDRERKLLKKIEQSIGHRLWGLRLRGQRQGQKPSAGSVCCAALANLSLEAQQLTRAQTKMLGIDSGALSIICT
jgi:DnaK suppressor protein